MMMPISQFEPSRAVEIIAPRYGSGYRIGGRLVLTAAHLLGDEGSDCEVRDKRSFGKQKAKVVYRRTNESLGIDIALLELPEKIECMEPPITLGRLPDATAGEKLAFQMYGHPLWARTQREQGSASGGRQIDGIIYPSDYSPDDWLVLEAKRLPPEATTAKSEWVGASGAAIVCDGLLIAVQRQHQNPERPASLEASHLWKVYDDEQWRQLLETNGISPELKLVSLPATTDKSLEIVWHNVSAQLLEARRQLTTNLMTRRGGVVYEVDQVFVPLGLVERKQVPRRRKDASPERGAEFYREGINRDSRDSDPEQEEITQKFEHQQFLEQVLQQGQSPKSQGKRLAIIGEPGAGKTTLLQQIGRWVLNTFPKSIVIWVSLADLQGDTLESYLEQRWLRGVIRNLGGAEASLADKYNFANQFKQGQVWLLLDGLDEMQGTGNPLSDIQRQIQEGGWLQQARILLTCRVNLWGSSRNALDAFDTYRTLEFSEPGQVELFIEKWFGENDTVQQGQALCKALQKPGKERIRDLVKNPLRLALLCFDWYAKGGQLPETQAELYQRFVENLYKWKSEKFPITAEQRQTLNQGLVQLSLNAIDDQDKRGNARFRLRHQFVKQYLSEDSLQLAIKLGWLNDIGVDADDLSETVYAFYHTTFEEYFAALAINDWDFFLPRKHRKRPIKDHPYRIFEPQWKQVFLLWLGREDRDCKLQKDTFIQALTTFKDGCKGFYSDRAFLLATAGLAEFKECSYADAIVDRLMQWKFGHPNGMKPWLFPGYQRLQVRSDLATRAIGSTNLQRVIQALVEVLESTQDEETRWKAAENLGKIEVGNETAIQELVRVLESTQDILIRWMAADLLGKIDPGNETAILALESILESTRDIVTCWRAARSLGKIEVGHETAIQELVRVFEELYSEKKHILRWRGSDNLGSVDPDHETTILALVQVLESTQHENIRKCAARSLSQSGVGNEMTILALVRVLESTQHEDIRKCAAKSLGQVGIGNEMAILALVQVLESTQHEDIRKCAAKSLGQVGIGNEMAILALVQVLESTQHEDIRKCAAESLGQVGIGNEMTILALVQVLESTQHESTSLSAAESLAKIDPGNETAILALVRILESTQLSFFTSIAAESLAKVEIGNETAIQELVRVLESKKDEPIRSKRDNGIRKYAASSLNLIDPDNETATQELVRVVGNKKGSGVILHASFSLDQIGVGNKTAIQELVRALRPSLRIPSGFRIPETDETMMRIAEALPYPEFYQSFHTSRWPF